MLSQQMLDGALNVILAGVEKALFYTACVNELRWQQQVHEEVPGIAVPIDNPRQFTDGEGNFKPNNEQAKEHAHHRIWFGVGLRLRGAIYNYNIGDQMECVRHIVLALDSIFCIIGWQEASAWCNQQNRVLFELHQKKEAQKAA